MEKESQRLSGVDDAGRQPLSSLHGDRLRVCGVRMREKWSGSVGEGVEEGGEEEEVGEKGIGGVRGICVCARSCSSVCALDLHVCAHTCSCVYMRVRDHCHNNRNSDLNGNLNLNLNLNWNRK